MKWLFAFLAQAFAALGWRQAGANSQKAKQATDAIEGAEEGRQGAQQARKDLNEGKTADQIVRDNDAKWD